MTSVSSITTAEQLLAAGDIGRCELIRGELLTMSPAGSIHGHIAMRLGRLIANHVEARRLGETFAAETGFVLARNPDTVRAADVGFVASNRLPAKLSPAFFEGPPDLAVEVLSPDDRASKIQEKVQDYLAAGCQMVWVVDPKSRTITVYSPDQRAQVLTEKDRLTGGDLLPGFELPVDQVFE